MKFILLKLDRGTTTTYPDLSWYSGLHKCYIKSMWCTRSVHDEDFNLKVEKGQHVIKGIGYDYFFQFIILKSDW